MKGILAFNLPEDQAEFTRASRAGDAFLAIEAFGAYLRGQEEHLDPEQRDDMVAVREAWFEAMGDLLDIP